MSMQVSTYDSLVPYPESATGYNLALSQNPIVCDAAGIPKVDTLDVTLWRKTGKDSMEVASGTCLKVWVNFPGSSRAQVTTEGKITVSLVSSDTIPKYVTSVKIEAGESSYDVHDIADLTVPVNRDGAEGKSGRLPVPYGEYSPTVTYTATDQIAPYVLYNGQYYVMNKTTSVKGLNPQSDYAANGQDATWILLEQFKAAFYEVIMAQLGLIGKAVFYNEYMYSQYGKKGTSSVVNEGNYDIPKDAGGTFDPNLLMNFLTGYFKCNNADITGHINATSGTFAGFVKIPFVGITEACSLVNGQYRLKDNYNLYNDTTAYDTTTLYLENNSKYNGVTLNLYTRERISKMDPTMMIRGSSIYYSKSKNSDGTFKPVSSIYSESGGYIQLVNIFGRWVVTIDAMADVSFNV